MSIAPSRGAALLARRLRRWRAGERLATEDVFALHPNARQDPDLAVELIRQEFFLRRSAGEEPSVEEFMTRFPEFAGHLAGRLGGPRAERRSSPGPGPHMLGRYVVRRRLGESDHGVVFKAHDPRRHAKVAVKLLAVRRSELDAADVAELRQRVATVAKLRHPNLTRLLGVGNDLGSPYLVREYVRGASLADWLRRRGKARDIRRAITLISKVAGALGALHEAGLVHGSVRPGNILLDAACEPHLTDPDLLHHLAPQVNRARAGSGTYVTVGPAAGFAYRAPEQRSRRGEAVGPPADVYSLGVVTHHVLAGVLPDGNPPLYHRPDLDPVLEVVLKQALARRASDRFANGNEFAAALTTWLKRKPFC
jgi:serine/threonine protein kinase